MERSDSHYQALGVAEDAKIQDINRAWKRYEADRHSEGHAPDRRRDARALEAFTVLSDPDRRAAYDAELRAQRRRSSRPMLLALGAIALVAVIAGALLATRKPAPSVAERPVSEVRTAVTLALGRVEILDMAGTSRKAGIATTTEEGAMLTPCTGLTAEAQLRVHSAGAVRAARLLETTPVGLCRLAVSGGAGFPLRVAEQPPANGERVYIATANASGESSVLEATLAWAEGRGNERVFVASTAPGADAEGAVLLDAQARVLGVAVAEPGGALRFRQPPTVLRR